MLEYEGKLNLYLRMKKFEQLKLLLKGRTIRVKKGKKERMNGGNEERKIELDKE